jgi:hypothetical protein
MRSRETRGDKREIILRKQTLGIVLGEGKLETYVLGVHLDRLGFEEESDAPFVPVQ